MIYDLNPGVPLAFAVAVAVVLGLIMTVPAGMLVIPWLLSYTRVLQQIRATYFQTRGD